jgi:hypothetical protein
MMMLLNFMTGRIGLSFPRPPQQLLNMLLSVPVVVEDTPTLVAQAQEGTLLVQRKRSPTLITLLRLGVEVPVELLVRFQLMAFGLAQVCRMLWMRLVVVGDTV